MPPVNAGKTQKLSDKLYFGFRKVAWNVVRLFRRYVTLQTRQGIFTLDLRDESITRHLFVLKHYELGMVNKIIRFLKEKAAGNAFGSGTMLDIGANNGVISIGMLYNRQFQQAVAFEPEPHNFSLLRKNIANNHFEERILTLQSAVSNQKGSLEFEVSDRFMGVHRVKRASGHGLVDPHNESEQRKVVQVPCDTLDSILESLPEKFTSNIQLIWMDIQGHEGFAFQGAEKLLSRNIPLVTEVWPYGVVSAGMKVEEYCLLAQKYWNCYWVLRGDTFVKYPIQGLQGFFDELGYAGAYTNIIFTREAA